MITHSNLTSGFFQLWFSRGMNDLNKFRLEEQDLPVNTVKIEKLIQHICPSISNWRDEWVRAVNYNARMHKTQSAIIFHEYIKQEINFVRVFKPVTTTNWFIYLTNISLSTFYPSAFTETQHYSNISAKHVMEH